MKKLEEKLSMLLDKPVWVFRRDGYNIQDVGTGNIIQTFDDRAKLDAYVESLEEKYKEEKNYIEEMEKKKIEIPKKSKMKEEKER